MHISSVSSRLRTISLSRKPQDMRRFWMKVVTQTSRAQCVSSPRTSEQPPIATRPTSSGLLKYLVGNSLYLHAAGALLGSVLVMTDADWARDVKDRRSYSGKAVWVKSSTMETWCPVYASSKKENMICLSSGKSELMALVGGACEGIATRDQWSKMCGCSNGAIVSRTDRSRLL